jgi:hypothetical protein
MGAPAATARDSMRCSIPARLVVHPQPVQLPKWTVHSQLGLLNVVLQTTDQVPAVALQLPPST